MFLLKKWIGLASAVGVLSVAGMVALVTPVSAAPAPSVHTAVAGITTSALPNSNIKGSPPKWSPTKLTVAPKKFSKCTAAKVAFTLTNKTTKTQTIQAKSGSGAKVTLGKLKAGQKAGLCAQGPKGAKADFFIKGAKSKLVVTLS